MSIKGDARNMGAAQRPAFIQCYSLRLCHRVAFCDRVYLPVNCPCLRSHL